MTGVAIVGWSVSSPQDVAVLELAPRDRKMMSPAAMLATHCMAALLGSLAWRDRDDIGCYLGVGASGGSIDEFLALLDASLVDGELSLARFGDRGLAACHPLLAFQLMNNFTLCHGAIREALGGPNGAVFSRGAGTVTAIAEAVHAVRSRDCDRAIAGGADAPSHPATLAELDREGFVARGLVVTDAAALLALASSTAPGVPADAVVVEGCGIASGRPRALGEALDEAVKRAGRSRSTTAENQLAAETLVPARQTVVANDAAPTVIVIAPWGPPAETSLRAWACARYPVARIVSTRELALGDSLAATPAIAVILASRQLEPGQRAIVVTLGVDGDPGAILLSRGLP